MPKPLLRQPPSLDIVFVILKCISFFAQRTQTGGCGRPPSWASTDSARSENEQGEFQESSQACRSKKKKKVSLLILVGSPDYEFLKLCSSLAGNLFCF